MVTKNLPGRALSFVAVAVPLLLVACLAGQSPSPSERLTAWRSPRPDPSVGEVPQKEVPQKDEAQKDEAQKDATQRASDNHSPDSSAGVTQLPLDGRDGRELSIRNFYPKSWLRVRETTINRAKFPVVDVHTHFRYRLRHSPEALDDYVALMDRNGIAICVSLDGRWYDELTEHEGYLWSRYKDRFAIFVNIDWRGDGKEDRPETWACQRSDFARRTVEHLRASKRRGACGVKIFKQFGLGYENADGTLLKIDDRRFDPIWEECGRLGLPIIIHTADPAAFFDPIDPTNERWEELSRHPDWSFHGERYPSREELLAARNRVIERHPKTTFLGAHVANNAEDLEEVARWLDRYPNLYIEFASRIGELGRQPYTARDFVIRYADRIMFGTDGPWPETRVRLYWRFLQTRDEYFPYSEKQPPPQGLWNIYGIYLPDEVLRKVYYQNAARVIPGVSEKLKMLRERGVIRDQD